MSKIKLKFYFHQSITFINFARHPSITQKKLSRKSFTTLFWLDSTHVIKNTYKLYSEKYANLSIIQFDCNNKTQYISSKCKNSYQFFILIRLNIATNMNMDSSKLHRQESLKTLHTFRRLFIASPISVNKFHYLSKICISLEMSRLTIYLFS